MYIIEPGHIYDLENRNNGVQRLTFIKNLPEDSLSNHDGVSCQEVLRALIDRVLELNRQVPCHENIEIINKLRECIVLFETRAVSRMLTKSYSKTGKCIEELPVESNGHIFDIRNIK